MVEAARTNHIWVGVCGELAGDPDAIPILLGLGIDELSVSSPSVPKTKDIIRECTSADAEKLASEALKVNSAEDVRKLVKSTAIPQV